MLLFNFILRPKVTYPKYYQYRNESCNFAFIGQIGLNHTFEFIFHIFMEKMNTKLKFLYGMAVRVVEFSSGGYKVRNIIA